MLSQIPSNRETLISYVQNNSDSELRAVGSRTSKSPCFETQGSEINLRNFSKMERIGPTQVRVGAGVVLSDLLNFLGAERLALPTIGEWAGQTIAGVISTGTHGGSYRHGSVCTSVAKVVFIDGTGKERSLSRGDKNFDLLLPSFGTTGVLVEFDLDCVPYFHLSMGRRCIPWEHYLQELLENPQNVEYRAAIWLPAAASVIDYSCNKVASSEGFATSREPRFSDTAMVYDWISRQPTKWSQRASFSKIRKVAQLSTSLRQPLSVLFHDKHYTGSYENILAPLTGTAENILEKRKRNRTPPEGEFAVSYDKAAELLSELDRLFRLEGLAPDRPIGLRPGIGESGALSATQDGPSIWVSMFIYPDNPLMEVLPDILKHFRARPHWGKCVFHRPTDIPGLYPRWDEFCAFRKEMDPAGIFLNPFAKDFGMQ